MTDSARRIYVGNLESVLFRQRIEHLQELMGVSTYKVLNTGRKSRWDFARFAFVSVRLIIATSLSPRSTRLLLHGAYSPFLWVLLFLPQVRTVSILQGSELNTDFRGLRARIITLILRRSTLVACRNQTQREQVVRLCGARPERCVVVNWGLRQELFVHALSLNNGDPVVISPRATQTEYNIPVIFEVIARLKKEGHRLRFVYVRFNSKFEVDNASIADEVLESPAQDYLWERIAAADLCISVPDYDGLSNTVLEALALGSLPVFSDLAPYAFLKQDQRLGIPVEFGPSNVRNEERLYVAIKEALLRIEKIRSDSEFRRNFAEKNYKIGVGIDGLVKVLNA